MWRWSSDKDIWMYIKQEHKHRHEHMQIDTNQNNVEAIDTSEPVGCASHR